MRDYSEPVTEVTTTCRGCGARVGVGNSTGKRYGVVACPNCGTTVKGSTVDRVMVAATGPCSCSTCQNVRSGLVNVAPTEGCTCDTCRATRNIRRVLEPKVRPAYSADPPPVEEGTDDGGRVGPHPVEHCTCDRCMVARGKRPVSESVFSAARVGDVNWLLQLAEKQAGVEKDAAYAAVSRGVAAKHRADAALVRSRARLWTLAGASLLVLASSAALCLFYRVGESLSYETDGEGTDDRGRTSRP